MNLKNLDMTTFDVENFFEKYLCDKKDKMVSVDRAFILFICTYNISKTKENLNSFIVGFLKSGYEVISIDEVLFFCNLTWKEFNDGK